MQVERSSVFGTRSVASARAGRAKNLTRTSSYPVAELQRKLTTTWFDITSTRICSCWRWATRGSILTANAIRTIRARRVILAIRVILPPDTTSLSLNYPHRHRICRIHPLPIPRMHTCTFTTTVTREPDRTRDGCVNTLCKLNEDWSFGRMKDQQESCINNNDC